MAKTRERKEEELQLLHEKFGKSKSVVFAQYLGLNVADVHTLRTELRQEGNEMVVAKKSLIGLMLEKAGLEKNAMEDMEGGIAVIFGYEDEVAPAKVVAAFAKKHEVVGFRGGILEGAFISAEKVTALSAVPSRPELYAKLVGSLNSPISGFVNVLGGPMRGLVQTLSQIQQQKQ